MQPHGPNNLPSPVRGTPGWWQELGQVTEPTRPVKKKRSRKASAGIRTDLVERVRREIAAGTYETQEKWEAALDCLLDNLLD